jgi:hypothetical protein
MTMEQDERDPTFCAGECGFEVRACDDDAEHGAHDYSAEDIPDRFFHCRGRGA